MAVNRQSNMIIVLFVSLFATGAAFGESTLNAEERRVVEHDVKQIIDRLIWHYDNFRYEEVGSFFSEDGVWDSPTSGVYRGPHGIAEGLRNRPDDRLVRHVVPNLVTDFIDDDHVTVVSYLLAFVNEGAYPLAEGETAGMHIFYVGEWHWDFVRSADTWKISYKKTVPVFLQQND